MLYEVITFNIPVRALSAHFSQAQIKSLHVLIVPQLFHSIIQDDPSVLHDIAVVGYGQSQSSVLLNQQNCGLLFFVDLLDYVRITSYNVCYTKLFRLAGRHHPERY